MTKDERIEALEKALSFALRHAGPKLNAAHELLIKASIASCTCLTKSPDVTFHAADCRYVHLEYALENIEQARHALNATGADQGGEPTRAGYILVPIEPSPYEIDQMTSPFRTGPKFTGYLAARAALLDYYANRAPPSPGATKEELREALAKRWRHVKRGSTYVEIGRGFVQTSGPIVEGETMVAYRSDATGDIWFRPATEFDDGRFVEIDAILAKDAEPKEEG